MNSLQTIIEGFKSISLREMDSVALLNRTDTKFMVSTKTASDVLRELTGSYRVLQVEENRIFGYRTIYFDTINKDLLYEHLRGKLNRVKVRARAYVGTATRFFEVKLKTNKGKTIKSRIPKLAELNAIHAEEANFLSSVSNLNADALVPVVEINFKRTTLVSLAFKERITFDFQLSFSGNQTEKQTENLVIIELKRDSFTSERSPASTVLKEHAVYPSSLSKYCLGMILLDETKMYNAYKPKLLKLNKLSANGNIW